MPPTARHRCDVSSEMDFSTRSRFGVISRMQERFSFVILVWFCAAKTASFINSLMAGTSNSSWWYFVIPSVAILFVVIAAVCIYVRRKKQQYRRPMLVIEDSKYRYLPCPYVQLLVPASCSISLTSKIDYDADTRTTNACCCCCQPFLSYFWH